MLTNNPRKAGAGGVGGDGGKGERMTDEEVVCERCGKPGTLGPCPFGVEIHDIDPDDESKWCSCCEDCRQECFFDTYPRSHRKYAAARVR